MTIPQVYFATSVLLSIELSIVNLGQSRPVANDLEVVQ